MIEVRGLAKYYGGQPAIESLDFNIARGEIVGLLGLNGAGKSTVLKILGAFLVPSSGFAAVAGFSVDTDPQGVRHSIGFLPDVPPLYKEMTVEGYLDFVLRLKVGGNTLTKSEVEKHISEALTRTSLVPERKRTLGELSHGYAQRVGIAQAIIHKPPVLILDEPINGLDPVQIVEMRDLILSFRQEHTVILSSHILSEITKTCDRILILDQGHLVAQGTEQDLSGSLRRSMLIRGEVKKNPQDLLPVIENIKGVSNISWKKEPRDLYSIELESEADVRSQFARLAVQLDLVSLTQEEIGLESLFLKLIGPEPNGRGKGK